MKKELLISALVLVLLSTSALAIQTICGDNYCETNNGETIDNCAFDCINNLCGNTICNAGENKDNCPVDCWKNDKDYTVYARDMATTYHTYNETITMLKSLEAAYPNIISHEVIGQTIQGKDIYLFKIGNINGGRFLFDGRNHGMEDCGTENGMAFINWVLTNNSLDSNNVKNNNLLLFIPGINIDSTRRQNMRRSYPDGTAVIWGVDLNKNGIVGWGGSGSSSPTSNIDYRGESALSEPESQAVYNTIIKYQPKIYLNNHCGNRILDYRANSPLTQKIISNIKNLSTKYGRANTMNWYAPTYGPGIGECTGGYFCAMEELVSGGSGWLLETIWWDELPITLNGYINKYYTQVFPIYLGMAQAAANNSAIPPPSIFCGDGTCNGNETCTICSADCGACPPAQKIVFNDVRLTIAWSGTNGTAKVYRDSILLGSTSRGSYSDRIRNPVIGTTYNYKVCNSYTCSDNMSVTAR